jgi:sulfoxide reductase heme-binding subunit YedZ
MGTLAVVHAIAFIAPNQEFFLSKEFWLTSAWYPTAYAWWYAAYLMTLPLLFTSSNWAIRKLGKKWKTLHKLVYIIVIFVVVHVVLIKAFRWFEVTPVIILILYFVAKTLEWRWVKFGRDVKISSEERE